MISMTIGDRKTFMAQLLSGSFFDPFFLVEATVRMGITHHIDGRLNRDFYDCDQSLSREYCLWKEARGYLYEIVKGKRQPAGMKIVLALAPSMVDRLVNQCGSFRKEEISGMFLNIHFSPQQLQITTGISYHCFTMDKSLEHLFDDAMKEFLAPLL